MIPVREKWRTLEAAIYEQVFTGVALLCLLSATALAEESTLELPLDGPQSIEVGDEQLHIDGQFVQTADGATALGIGEDFGPSIPAAPFFGETGTIAFTLSY